MAGEIATTYDALREIGVTELIGVNEQVAQYDWSASVEIDFGHTDNQGNSLSISGEILSVALYATEDGTGSIITEAGKLAFFDADPETSAGDANLAAGEWPTIVGIISVAAADWHEENSGGNGAMAYYVDKPIPFHGMSSIYAAYYHEGATQWNSAAGDEESLDFNAWYRRDS